MNAVLDASASPRHRMTEDEYLRLPEDGNKWELVEGEPVAVPTSFDHDLIKMLLLSRLLPIAMPLGYVTGGEAGCRMRGGNIRIPDVSFTRRERISEVRPQPGFGAAAPDLCVEILSPSEEPADVARKVDEYFESGATLVWHLFPQTRTLRVFATPTVSVERGPEDDLDGGTLLPGFRCRVGDLFDTGL
ncbi:MAG: Uma2 family endonuclease [Cytophagales bacterium]|nr:Uma2 family endonuclease [Armatimonadota bacterium]